MKFVIRDDDLNYFFDPIDIEKNFRDIWDICPISMSVIPFVKGDWKKQIAHFEGISPGVINEDVLKSIQSNNTIFPISDNNELTKFVNKEIKRNRIHITIHGIHHRNEDPEVPQLHSNYGIGAEFFTSRDLYGPLKAAIIYLEKTFNQPIKVFTPPQNLLSLNGIKAVNKAGLAICGNFPIFKQFSTFRLFGFFNYFKYAVFKICFKFKIYPFVLLNKEFRFVGHHSLQPGTNINNLYDAFEKNYHLPNSVFIISTHSYAFNLKMNNSEKKMGEVLKEFVDYAAKKTNVHFVTMNEIFDETI
jgi:hypothetical protein